jgi:anaerobic selenocysteine-containing dehydrogenase
MISGADPEEERLAARWPLRLLTAPATFRATRPFPASRSYAGARVRLCCILHPEEAGARHLRDGQPVRLFNDRGSVGLVLKLSDEIQHGVVQVPGQRPDSETVSGTINMLCSDRFTDIGEGATYQSTWLDIAAWPELPP